MSGKCISNITILLNFPFQSFKILILESNTCSTVPEQTCYPEFISLLQLEKGLGAASFGESR